MYNAILISSCGDEILYCAQRHAMQYISVGNLHLY